MPTPRLRTPWRTLAALALAILLCAPLALAQPAGQRDPFGGDDPNEGARIPASQAEGRAIDRVYLHVVNPTGDPARDQRARAEIEAAFGVAAGDTFTQSVVEQAVKRVAALAFVEAAQERSYRPGGTGTLVVALLVRLQPPAAKPAPAARGFLVTGRLKEAAVLYETGRGQLRLIANPSVGAFSDQHAWLGNPTDFRPSYDVPASQSWPEFGLEFGLTGIRQVGSGPVYVYGAVSYVASGTLAPDVFSSASSTTHGALEKSYGGVLVAKKGAPAAFDLSVGRQRFSLNRNFLFGHVLGSGNGAYRAAAYLSPRSAQDLVVNARFRYGKALFQAFVADPNELDVADTKSRFAGLNVRYNDNKRVDLSLTMGQAVSGTTRYSLPDGTAQTREGLRVVNPRARWNGALGVPGLWVEGEFAHEWHSKFAMSANGAGGWVGYHWSKAPWRPTVFYRYSWFGGDTPGTAAYERFDPLLGGVQREWLQGLVMVKMMNNANVLAHRVEVSVRPRRGMDLSVDFYSFRAQQANNLGASARPFQSFGNLDLGYEITPTLQWSITPNVYVQSLVSRRVPGPGFSQALSGPAKAWTTFQLAFYAGL
jgi:hypothetical protein